MKKIITIEPLGFPWKTKDPFLFCAYHKDDYPAGNENMGIDWEELKGRNVGEDFTIKNGYRMYHGKTIPGFPYHPHRGFETITINKQGYVDHSDSLGAAGRFGKGDVQWMTAGSGIQHSEMFPLINSEKENPLEIFQLWLNLPKKSKFVKPHFRMLWEDMIPLVKEKDSNGNEIKINIIAGNYKNINAPNPTPNSWAADIKNSVTILTIEMEANATWILPSNSSEEVTKTIYFYKGETIKIDHKTINESHLIEVNPNEDIEITNGNSKTFLLILQGKPINEPVVKFGPFVMNTEEEIKQTMKDYGKTQFGGWPWPEIEQVHDRTKGRFALHADGTKEIK